MKQPAQATTYPKVTACTTWVAKGLKKCRAALKTQYAAVQFLRPCDCTCGTNMHHITTKVSTMCGGALGHLCLTSRVTALSGAASLCLHAIAGKTAGCIRPLVACLAIPTSAPTPCSCDLHAQEAPCMEKTACLNPCRPSQHPQTKD